MALIESLRKNYGQLLSVQPLKTEPQRSPIKLATPVRKLHEGMLMQCAFEIHALPLARREAACQRLALTENLHRRLTEICNFITRIEGTLEKTKASRSLPVFQRIKSYCSFKKRGHTRAIFSPAIFSHFASIIEKVAKSKNQYISLSDLRRKMQECSGDSALLDMVGLWYVCDISNQEELTSFCQDSAYIRKIRVCYSIGDQGIVQLANALKSNGTLTSLVIWQKQIGDAEAQTLAGALQENKALKELHLPANQIGNKGACAFAAALKVNTTLTELGLSGNSVGSEGGKMLAEALEVNSSLTHLSLFANYYLHAEGVLALANALLMNKTLQRLDLGSNEIGIEGLDALKRIQSLYPKRDIILGFAERSA